MRPTADLPPSVGQLEHTPRNRRAATELFNAIYKAAREIDWSITAERRAAVLDALGAAGIANGPGEAVLGSAGNDMRVWLSIASAGRS